MKALVDSGSSRTYLGKVYEPLLKDALIPSSAKVQLADNSIAAGLSGVNTQLSLHGTRKALPVHLDKSLRYHSILKIDFLKLFGLIVDFGERNWSLAGKDVNFFLIVSLTILNPSYFSANVIDSIAATDYTDETRHY